MPRTFYKLVEKWDKKVGARNFESSCWTSTTVDKREPIHNVAYLMSEKLRLHSSNMFHKLTELSCDCQGTINQQIWIYDMRQSDNLPKSQADTQRLYGFVERLVKSWFDAQEKDYLLKHCHITTCFFVWYFTKPEFFYKDNVTKQTTRNGIRRVWTPLLLRKMEKTSYENVTTPSSKNKFTNTTDTLLPKQQQHQTKLREEIQQLLSATKLKNTSIDWQDSQRTHMKISECMNTNSGLSIKQNKKLQKMYNDYTTITTKINKTMLKVNKVKRANSRLASNDNDDTIWDSRLGPPGPPTKLIRKSACESEEGVTVPAERHACATNLPDKLLPDEFVPESWEDL